MVHLTINDYLLPGETFHIFRITHSAENPLGMHDHLDFAEIFFVEAGEGYHLVNGEQIELFPGRITFVRPQDRHTVSSKDEKSRITIINTAFKLETLYYLYQRYFEGTNDYFWSNEKVPAHHILDAVRLQNLITTAEHIFKKPHNNKFLDPFLLKIVEMIEPKTPSMYPADTPSWLIYALDNYQDPGHFEKGISGFSELACRSPEHINRALRKYLNITLSEAVNAAKVNFAARKLIMSDEKITNIALECGIPSLGHFYKIFKNKYGLTPDQFRKRNKNLL